MSKVRISRVVDVLSSEIHTLHPGTVIIPGVDMFDRDELASLQEVSINGFLFMWIFIGISADGEWFYVYRKPINYRPSDPGYVERVELHSENGIVIGTTLTTKKSYCWYDTSFIVDMG